MINQALTDIEYEMGKQNAKFGAEHDDQHDECELLAAASGILDQFLHQCGSDPWGIIAKHRGDKRKLLVIAGALIGSEIQRMDRAALKAKQP